MSNMDIVIVDPIPRALALSKMFHTVEALIDFTYIATLFM